MQPVVLRCRPAIGLGLALFTAMGSGHAQELLAPETGGRLLSGPSGYGYMPNESRFVDPYADVRPYRDGEPVNGPRAGSYGVPYGGDFSPGGRSEREMYGAPGKRAFYGPRPQERQSYPGQGYEGRYEDRYVGAYPDGYSEFPETNPYPWADFRSPGTPPAWEYERSSGVWDRRDDRWSYPSSERRYRSPGPGIAETDVYAGRSFETPAWNRPEPYGNDRYPPAAIRRQGRYQPDVSYGGPGMDRPAPYVYRDRWSDYPLDYFNGGLPYSGLAPGYGSGYYPGLTPGYDAPYWNIPGIGDMRFPGRFPGGFDGLPFRFDLF